MTERLEHVRLCKEGKRIFIKPTKRDRNPHMIVKIFDCSRNNIVTPPQVAQMIEQSKDLCFFHELETFRILAQRAEHCKISGRQSSSEATFSKNGLSGDIAMVL